jgi:hypothetical protein
MPNGRLQHASGGFGAGVGQVYIKCESKTCLSNSKGDIDSNLMLGQ